MNIETFDRLNPKQQFWYAQIMIDMVLADNHIHESEEKYLDTIFHLFQERAEQLELLKQRSQQSSPGKVEPVKGITLKTARYILEDCVSVAISDTEFHANEKALIRKIAHELKVPSNLTESIIAHGHETLGYIFNFAS